VKEVGGSDQQTLLRVTEALVQHVCTAPGGSLIARFYMHFRRQRDGKDYIVMNNWLPPTGRQQWAEVYDLKGSADDKLMLRNGESVPAVHKRCWHVHKYLQCCWSEERHQYYWGKHHAYEVPFHCTPHDREAIMQMLEQDARFMREQGLMDYSIIVGVQREDGYTPGQDCGFSESSAEGQPYTCVFERGACAYFLGIIDFLQGWTAGKKVAQAIKRPVAPQPQSTVPPAEYAVQFLRHFDQKFVGDAHELPPPVTVSATSTAGLVAHAPSGGHQGRRAQAGYTSGLGPAPAVRGGSNGATNTTGVYLNMGAGVTATPALGDEV
jgi:hypothetical protein